MFHMFCGGKKKEKVIIYEKSEINNYGPGLLIMRSGLNSPKQQTLNKAIECCDVGSALACASTCGLAAVVATCR